MRRRELGACASLIVIVTVAVYLFAFPGEFHYDDYPLMLENEHVTGDHFPMGLFLDQYGGRPLTIWTFYLNYRLAGPEILSFQTVNLGLHLIASVLVLLLIRSFVRNSAASLLAALLFAIHPLQTQSVNYNWSRSVLLMTCFSLGAFLIARRASEDCGRLSSAQLIATLALFQFAIWSRTEALVLAVPIAIVLPRIVVWLAPVALINAALFVRSLWLYAPREVAWNHSDSLSYWLAQPPAILKYLSLMLWPTGQTIDHDFSPGQPLWFTVASLAALAALGAVLVIVPRFRPHALFGYLAFLLALLPSALVPNSDLLNESRAYPAMVGFCVMTAGGFSILLGRRGPLLSWQTAVGAVLLVGLLAPVTATRNRIWTSEVSVWEDAAAKSPMKGRVHYNLGVARARIGEVDRAESAFGRARSLDPGDDFSYAGLGYCREKRRDLAGARDLYQKALSINPANVYAKQGIERIQKLTILEEPAEPL